MKAILMDGAVIEEVGGFTTTDNGVILREGRDQKASLLGYVPRENLWAVVPDKVDTEPPKDNEGKAVLQSPDATKPHS